MFQPDLRRNCYSLLIVRSCSSIKGERLVRVRPLVIILKPTRNNHTRSTFSSLRKEKTNVSEIQTFVLQKMKPCSEYTRHSLDCPSSKHQCHDSTRKSDAEEERCGHQKDSEQRAEKKKHHTLFPSTDCRLCSDPCGKSPKTAEPETRRIKRPKNRNFFFSPYLGHWISIRSLFSFRRKAHCNDALSNVAQIQIEAMLLV
jgi:hypothetical protein